MKPAAIRDFYSTLRAANPEPRTELVYATPYQLLVAVILSAQATDRSVNAASAELFRVAPDAAAMVKLGEAQLRHYIRTIGLFNSKASHIIAASQLLLDHHGGDVPADREALEALPGVGRKTANVVLNAAFGAETIAVDTHLFRVANRTGLAAAATPRAVEEKLLAVTPPEFLRHAHHWLILLGRYTCKARRPLCAQCLVVRYCNFKHKALAAVAPVRVARS